MQKKLIALAIAGLATAPAFAQTNVTIYGVADVTIENVKASGGDADTALPNSNDFATRLSRNRVTSNSSLIGFRGVEDLGNGLKALFQFETGVNADGGSTTGLFGGQRDTFVGLTSNAGTVVLGLLTGPMRNMGAKADLTPGATGIGLSSAMAGQIQTRKGAIHTTIDDRTANAIAYVSPSFAGLTVTAAYAAFGETSTLPSDPTVANSVDRKPRVWTAGVQYENGPLYAGLGYAEIKDPQIAQNIDSTATLSTSSTSSNFNDKLKDWRAVGKYTLGTGTTISALWDQAKVDVSGALSGDVKRDAWLLGVAQDFGPHNFFVEYAQANKLRGSGCDDGTNFCDDTKARFWSAGYNYSLSKRTMIKTYYASIRNDKNANYDFYLTSVFSGGGVTFPSTGGLAGGADPRGFGVGIRHVF